jgi:two-component system LytT family response regulator
VADRLLANGYQTSGRATGESAMGMKPVRTLIVDDEPLSRQRLRTLLEADPEVTVVGECADGAEAAAELQKGTCDLVFLDIQMPMLNGLEVVKAVGPESMPAFVFVTAHRQFAVDAFEFRAVDYLLKPFDRARFERSLAWAKQQVRRGTQAEASAQLQALRQEGQAGRGPLDRVLIKAPGRFYFVKTDEIDWIEAAGNYLRLHAGGETHLLRETMTSLDRRLEPGRFVRIHRSTIVNVERIREFQTLFHGDYVVILKDGTELTMSRSYRQNLADLVGDTL